MRARWIGLVLALALVAAAVGYGVGVHRRDEPVSFTAEPVPAQSPSYPVLPVVVLPDPDFPALRTGLPLHPVTVGTPPFDFTVPIPKGWIRTNPTSGEWHWHPPPGALPVPNTYFIRVKLLGNQFLPVSDSLEARITALENAPEVTDLDIESRDADSFVADYVAGGHRRVTMERFVGDGTGTTFASIAVIGREADRDGLTDLFHWIPAGAQAG